VVEQALSPVELRTRASASSRRQVGGSRRLVLAPAVVSPRNDRRASSDAAAQRFCSRTGSHVGVRPGRSSTAAPRLPPSRAAAAASWLVGRQSRTLRDARRDPQSGATSVVHAGPASDERDSSGRTNLTVWIVSPSLLLGDITVALCARRSLVCLSQTLPALPGAPLTATHRQGHEKHHEHDRYGNNDDKPRPSLRPQSGSARHSSSRVPPSTFRARKATPTRPATNGRVEPNREPASRTRGCDLLSERGSRRSQPGATAAFTRSTWRRVLTARSRR
jgi:hypothetical protein